MAAVEEFGIAAVEAQAAGRPVIAVRSGGTLETVNQGRTGCFWDGGPEELAAAVAGFDDAAVDPADCVENAARFDVERLQAGAAARGGAHDRRAGLAQPLAAHHAASAGRLTRPAMI